MVNNNSTSLHGMPQGVTMRHLVEIICDILAPMLEHPKFAVFNVPSTRPGGPDESVHLYDFIRTVIRRSAAPAYNVIIGGLYIKKFRAAYPMARCREGGAHRVFLTCLMLAFKMQEDNTYSNASWARVGQYFSLSDINTCEMEMLRFLSWDLIITPDEYDAASACCQHHAADQAAASAAALALKVSPRISPKVSPNTSSSSQPSHWTEYAGASLNSSIPDMATAMQIS